MKIINDEGLFQFIINLVHEYLIEYFFTKQYSGTTNQIDQGKVYINENNSSRSSGY